jgi:hypothetical protein
MPIEATGFKRKKRHILSEAAWKIITIPLNYKIFIFRKITS